MPDEESPLLPSTSNVNSVLKPAQILRLLLILDFITGSLMFAIYYIKYPNVFQDFPYLLQNVPFDLLLLCILRSGLLLLFVLKVKWTITLKTPALTTFVANINSFLYHIYWFKPIWRKLWQHILL